MHVELSEEEQVFRDETRRWLEDNVPKAPLPPRETPEGLEKHREWEKRLLDAGYGAVSWPTEFGGGGLSHMHQAIFDEEYALAGAPLRLNEFGLSLAGPTILKFGSLEQKSRWVNRIVDCSDLWCQGFSEPGSGSDLASLRTRAVRDGDSYVINGQKIWTTLGHNANWMFALVRTSEGPRPHAGITFVMIPMTESGVTVRQITQLNGDRKFCEVFFDEVRIPIHNRIGDEDSGWAVAMATLGLERGVGTAPPGRFTRKFEYVLSLLRRAPEQTFEQGLDHAAVGRLAAQVVGHRYHLARLLDESTQQSGDGLGPSVNKLLYTELDVALHEAGLAALGQLGTASSGPGLMSDVAALHPDSEWVEWSRGYWYARAAMIFGGSNEIQRNIIAERYLGLPKEWKP